MMNTARVQRTRKVFPSSPRNITLTVPPAEQLAFYAGVGAMAIFGIMEWPVVAALVVGHVLVNSQHNKVLQSLGEALEEL
jgi:predicted membrane protein